MKPEPPLGAGKCSEAHPNGKIVVSDHLRNGRSLCPWHESLNTFCFAGYDVIRNFHVNGIEHANSLKDETGMT